jgi:hypothetical protein
MLVQVSRRVKTGNESENERRYAKNAFGALISQPNRLSAVVMRDKWRRQPPEPFLCWYSGALLGYRAKRKMNSHSQRPDKQ